MTYITIGIPALYVFGGERSAAVRKAREMADKIAMFPSANPDRAKMKRIQREDLGNLGPLVAFWYCDGDSNGKASRQVTRAEFLAMAGPVLVGEA